MSCSGSHTYLTYTALSITSVPAYLLSRFMCSWEPRLSSDKWTNSRRIEALCCPMLLHKIHEVSSHTQLMLPWQRLWVKLRLMLLHLGVSVLWRSLQWYRGILRVKVQNDFIICMAFSSDMLRNFEHLWLIRFCTSSVYSSIFKKWVCNIFLRNEWNYFIRYHTSTIFIKWYLDLADNIKRKRERDGQGERFIRRWR